MKFFIKHQKVILRTLGSLLVVISFAIYFWTTPKKGLSENEIAAANVARMEARIAGQMGAAAPQKPKHSPFLETYKQTQAKQLRYTLIIMMILGVGFLGYSFIRRD